MILSPPAKKYIVHWGEMGTRWGVNRTVAQIHALLHISEQPLTAEEISASLSVARSTVSTGLRELQSWGIIKIVHILGDRRDHFEALNDVWEMFRIVVDERKRREMDPTIEVLRETLIEIDESNDEDKYAKQKIAEMLDFFETMITLYEQIQSLPLDALIRISKSSGVVRKLLGLSKG